MKVKPLGQVYTGDQLYKRWFHSSLEHGWKGSIAEQQGDKDETWALLQHLQDQSKAGKSPELKVTAMLGAGTPAMEKSAAATSIVAATWVPHYLL